MLFIQIEGAPRSADSTTIVLLSKLKVSPVAFTVLFIQNEDVLARKGKNERFLKVVEKFE